MWRIVGADVSRSTLSQASSKHSAPYRFSSLVRLAHDLKPCSTSLPLFKKILYGLRRFRSNRIRPLAEFFSVVAEILPVRFRHMLRLNHGLTPSLFQSHMDGDPGLLVKDFHHALRQLDVHSFADQVVRNGVLVETVTDQIVIANFQRKPCGRLIRMNRKRLHERFFFLFVGRTPAACAGLLEWTAVQFLQLLLHGGLL